MVHRSNARIIQQHVQAAVFAPNFGKHVDDSSLVRDIQAEMIVILVRKIRLLAAASHHMEARAHIVFSERSADALSRAQ